MDSVNNMFSLYVYFLFWLFPILVSRVLIASVPNHCLPFTFWIVEDPSLILSRDVFFFARYPSKDQTHNPWLTKPVL